MLKQVDFDVEPKIDALIDLSESDDDIADSLHLNTTDLHRENIQSKLDDAKREDPKIIILMNHGYQFEILAVMSDEELKVFLMRK